MIDRPTWDRAPATTTTYTTSLWFVGVDADELDGRWLVTFAKLDLGHADHTGFTPL